MRSAYGTAVGLGLVDLAFTKSLDREQMDMRIAPILASVSPAAPAPVYPPAPLQSALLNYSREVSGAVDEALDAFGLYIEPETIEMLDKVKNASVVGIAVRLRNSSLPPIPENGWEELIRLHNQLARALARAARRLHLKIDTSPSNFLWENEQPSRYSVFAPPLAPPVPASPNAPRLTISDSPPPTPGSPGSSV